MVVVAVEEVVAEEELGPARGTRKEDFGGGEVRRGSENAVDAGGVLDSAEAVRG